MRKILLPLIIICFILNSAFAQDSITVHNPIKDTSDFILVDSSLAVMDTSFLKIDSSETEMKEIDEDLSEMFSEKIDSASNNWFVKNAFSSDSLEVALLDIYPTNLPDSIYIQRLEEIEQVIDLSYNKTVKSFIKMYTEKRREQVERMIGMSDYYFPMFEEALDRHDLPLELKYLPIVESALNPEARSRAGAMGLWQFMYGTGKQMKLEITSFVDERRDPMESSEAAAKYLKMLYDIYEDWHLAIAAYNCGPGNVNRAIRRSGGKTNYWEIYYRLPRETRGYVPLFIAATYVMNFYEEHNLVPQIPAMPIGVDTIMVNQYLHFDQVAEVLHFDKEHLQALNPMYRRGVIPATEKKLYPLVLPYEKVLEFIDKDTTVFAWEREKYFPNNTLVNPSNSSSGYFTPSDVKGKAKIIYTVRSGDTVGEIAEKYKIRKSDLIYWNNINRNLIKVGQKLAIYVPEKDKDKYANSTPTKTKQAKTVTNSNSGSDYNYEMYTVRSGDNVWDIAKKYDGVSIDDIIQLNNISNEKGLVVGQKLRIKKKS